MRLGDGRRLGTSIRTLACRLGLHRLLDGRQPAQAIVGAADVHRSRRLQGWQRVEGILGWQQVCGGPAHHGQA